MSNHNNTVPPHLPLPTSEAEVTAEWLQNALSFSFPEITVKSFDAERIGAEYGLASRIVRLRIAGSGSPESVVIKFWNTDGKAGAQEIFFYRTFGETPAARVPACYYAAFDPSRNRGVLLLESIQPALQGDVLQQLSLERAKALAGNLAGMHGQWVDSPVLSSADWLRPRIPWKRDESWFAPRRALFLERFSDRLNDLARALLDRIESVPAVVNQRLGEAPSTLLHGDLHLDNIVFERDTEPVILDWAGCAQGPLALDLYNLLFNICQTQDVEPVLAAYLSAFVAYAGKPLDSGAVRHQLAAAFLYNFAISTCGVARWLPESPREAAMIEIGLKRALRALRYWYGQDPALFALL